MNRTQGYGGDYVTHVALETDLEKAKKGVERAEARVAAGNDKLEAAKLLKEALHSDTKASRKVLTAAKRSRREATQPVADEARTDNDVVDAMTAKEERERQLEAAKQAVTFATNECGGSGESPGESQSRIGQEGDNSTCRLQPRYNPRGDRHGPDSNAADARRGT